MRVALSLYNFRPGQIGGAETNLRGVVGALGSLPGSECELRPFGAEGSVAALFGPDAPTGSVVDPSLTVGGGTREKLAGTARGLLPVSLPALKAVDADLVHYPAGMGLPRLDLPRVLTLFDVQHLEMPHFFSRGERAYRRVAYDGMAQRADAVITSSAYSAGQISRRLSIPEERISVIHLGVDHEFFAQQADEEAVAALGLPARFVYYPANNWPHKNHARLIDALAAVQDPEVHLVLTGTVYENHPSPLEMAARAGVASRVHHLGHIPRELLPEVFRRAVATVVPSLFEGFGAPPLEAMASGGVAIVSDIPVFREVCGDAAEHFSPDSPAEIAAAIDGIAADASLREMLRRRGAEHVAQFTWQRSSEQHLAVYRRVLS